jgi:ferredoxin
MDRIAQPILFLVGVFTLPSLFRQEVRAGIIGLMAAALGAGLLAIAYLAIPGKSILAGLVVTSGVILGIIFTLPIGNVDRRSERPSKQVDERTIMFARNRLKPGSVEYDSYYLQHPEHKEIDDAIRALPGLLSLKSLKADPLAFAATDAGLYLTEALRDAVDGPVTLVRQVLSPEAASQYLKHLARFFGARNCGNAEVKDYQVYSHIGRGSGVYGERIELNHPFVLVFTFEMAEEMVRTAPAAPAVMETARQYGKAAQTAIQVAAWIRSIGYEARAHIDGNYRLILPLAGRDAGLGEIGRMGLLMTPDLGPRVRLSAVTTNLPLVPDLPGDSSAVLDFCRICKKCAENCPSRTILLDDRQEIDGILRWKIDAEQCFRYWNVIGTDCGRCMMVCPYSHPDDPAHNLARWLITRSGAARRLALYLDDWIYLRKPKSRTGPDWTQINQQDD